MIGNFTSIFRIFLTAMRVLIISVTAQLFQSVATCCLSRPHNGFSQYLRYF